MLRWRTSHNAQSTFKASRHSFPEVVQVNCRPSACHRLDAWMAGNASSESQVRSGHVRPGQVKAGQACTLKAGPFDGAGAEKYIFTTAVYMRQNSKNEAKYEFYEDVVQSRIPPICKIQIPATRSKVWLPSVSLTAHTLNTKNMLREQALNAAMRRQTGNMLCQNPIISTSDVKPCARVSICFFSSRLFATIGSQGAVLLVSFQALGLFLYWPVSRCAKSKAKSINESGRMWG